MHRSVLAGSIVAATLAAGAVSAEGERLAPVVGNDTFSFADGNDTLIAPDGNDTLVPPPGA